MDERAVEERYMDIPRFRVKKADEIKVDDNPKKNNSEHRSLRIKNDIRNRH